MGIDFVTQTPTKPAYERILWSRPERKSTAGKLLVIGGNSHEFSRTQECFTEALQAGAGEVKVILPDKLKKLVGSVEGVEYADSTGSGSFSNEAMPQLAAAADWADGVLFSGELSKNSETELMVENLMEKIKHPTVVDIDLLPIMQRCNYSRPNTLTMLADKNVVQQIVRSYKLTQTIASASTMEQVRDVVRAAAKAAKLNLIYWGDGFVMVAAEDQLSQTNVNHRPTRSRLLAATSVVSMQFPGKQFEALTTGVYLSVNSSDK